VLADAALARGHRAGLAAVDAASALPVSV